MTTARRPLPMSYLESKRLLLIGADTRIFDLEIHASNGWFTPGHGRLGIIDVKGRLLSEADIGIRVSD